MNIRTIRTTLALSTALLLLAGCGGEDEGATPADAASASIVDTVDGLTLEDGWVKATDESMTGVFGTLTNPTEDDIHLVSVESEIAGMSELHVTVDDGTGGRVMKEAEDGFVIPAGGEHELAPGGDHLMLMQLTGPVETGQEVEVTLVDEDGQEYGVTVTARAFTGAEETYAPGEGHGEGHGDGGGMTSDDAATTDDR